MLNSQKTFPDFEMKNLPFNQNYTDIKEMTESKNSNY